MRIWPLVAVVALSACVQPTEEYEGGIVPGESVLIDGTIYDADQKTDWPRMIAPMDAAGNTVVRQSGVADTVVVSGSRDSRERAIEVLAQYCGRPIDPQGFDTQVVYQDPGNGDWWFDGFCG